MTLTADGELAYGWVSAAMLAETGCTEQEAEGFVGEVRALHGVEVALLFLWSRRWARSTYRYARSRVWM